MRWITREHVKVDRVACPWLIRKFVDHGKECSFEAILKKCKLTGDAALVLLGRIVNGADTDNTPYYQAEGPGLQAIAEGFRHLGYEDDHALNAAEWIVYDILYEYCREMVRRGNPSGLFAH
jgi:hypothetical protein